MTPLLATTQLAMGHTTLAMTNHYVSLSVQHLQKSHEKYSPMSAEKGSAKEMFGVGYWFEN